jgi:hypothetical protein
MPACLRGGKIALVPPLEPINGRTYTGGSGLRLLVRQPHAEPDPDRQSGVARRIACTHHRGQRTRFDDPVIEHLERVAARVPDEARAVTWLHDLLELTPVGRPELRAWGLTAVEERALGLLTRGPAEPYEDYVLRVASVPGRAGRIARAVKLADLDDHLAHGRSWPGAPPHAWARRRVLEELGAWPATALEG